MKIGRFNISLNKKAAAASLPFAMAQNSILFNVGDTAADYLREGYQKNPNLYAIMRKIIGAALKAKFELYDVTDRENPKLIEDDPLIDLLNRPSPTMSKASFEDAAFAYKLVTGNRFMYKVKNPVGKNKGKTGWLIVIPSQFISKIKQDQTGQISAFIYQQGDKTMVIPPEDMIFDKCFNSDGGVFGQSPLMAGREILAHDNDIIKANRKLTRNMGPDSIVTLGDGTQSYDQEQIDSFEEKFMDKYGGTNNYGKRMFTSEKVTNTPLGAKPDDLGIFEASKLTARQLCNIYGVSTILFNDNENSTYNNVENARKAMITEVVLPEVHAYLSSFNTSLVPEFAPDGRTWELRINKSAYEELKRDLLDETQALSQAFWLTLNEKRIIMGYPPLDIPAGDEIFLPMNTEPISIKSDAIDSLANATPKK